MMLMNLSSGLLWSPCDSKQALDQLLFHQNRLSINSKLVYQKWSAFVVSRRRDLRVYRESQQKEVQIRKFSPILESVLISGDGVSPSNQWTTVPDIWRTSAKKFGDRVALVDPYHIPATNMTYRQLEQEILNFCEGLRLIGLKPEEKLALFSDNSCRWLVADQGVLLLLSLPPRAGEICVQYLAKCMCI